PCPPPFRAAGLLRVPRRGPARSRVRRRRRPAGAPPGDAGPSPHQAGLAAPGARVDRRRPPRPHLPGCTAGGPRLMPNAVGLLGVPVAVTPKPDAVALLRTWMRAGDGRSRAAFIANAHTLNLAWEDDGYR